MTSREVIVVNKLAAPRVLNPGRANMNEIRVEIRVIFPPNILQFEADMLIENAAIDAKNELQRRLEELR